MFATGTRKSSKTMLKSPLVSSPISLFVKKPMDKAEHAASVERISVTAIAGRRVTLQTDVRKTHTRTMSVLFVEKMCHSEGTCWSKGQRNGDRRVRVAAARVESGEETKLKKKGRQRAVGSCSRVSEHEISDHSQEQC